MPRRLRASKRKARFVDPFDAALGPSPHRLALRFPDERERAGAARQWRAWDRSLEAAKFRLDDGIPLRRDAQVRLINLTAGRKLLSGRERPEKIEAAFAAHREAIDELLRDVVAELPPELPRLDVA